MKITDLVRQARAGRTWRPSHAKAILSRVIRPERNRLQGLADVDHLRAAATWLERAQDVSGDGGICGRFRLGTGWSASYPETTGYLVPTLLTLSDEVDKRFAQRAARAMEFLAKLQLPSGAFPGL